MWAGTTQPRIDEEDCMELVKRLSAVVHPLRRLLETLPVRHSARQIFHIAYHEATLQLVKYRLMTTDPARPIKKRRADRRNHHNVARERSESSHPPDGEPTVAKRESNHTHEGHDTNVDMSTAETQLPQAELLHEFVDDIVISDYGSVRVEPRGNYTHHEVLNMLRQLRPEPLSNESSLYPRSSETSSTMSTGDGSHFEPLEIESDRVIDPADVPSLSRTQSSAEVRTQLIPTHLIEEMEVQSMGAESPRATNA